MWREASAYFDPLLSSRNWSQLKFLSVMFGCTRSGVFSVMLSETQPEPLSTPRSFPHMGVSSAVVGSSHPGTPVALRSFLRADFFSVVSGSVDTGSTSSARGCSRADPPMTVLGELRLGSMPFPKSLAHLEAMLCDASSSLAKVCAQSGTRLLEHMMLESSVCKFHPE